MSEKRILEVLEEVRSEQTEMKVDMTEIRKDLNHHIEQTNILREEVSPIRNSHQQLIGMYKFLGFVLLLLSIAAGLSSMV